MINWWQWPQILGLLHEFKLRHVAAMKVLTDATVTPWVSTCLLFVGGRSSPGLRRCLFSILRGHVHFSRIIQNNNIVHISYSKFSFLLPRSEGRKQGHHACVVRKPGTDTTGGAVYNYAGAPYIFPPCNSRVMATSCYNILTTTLWVLSIFASERHVTNRQTHIQGCTDITHVKAMSTQFFWTVKQIA